MSRLKVLPRVVDRDPESVVELSAPIAVAEAGDLARFQTAIAVPPPAQPAPRPAPTPRSFRDPLPFD
ncbi:MAG: hypothetical protein HY329_24540 [Chloroflexi bacterium]|nr:hypothetical protein [Chloroflexota bacterium]